MKNQFVTDNKFHFRDDFLQPPPTIVLKTVD